MQATIKVIRAGSSMPGLGMTVSFAVISFSFEIPPAKMLFQPHIGADEKRTAAHFLDLQSRLAETAAAPGDRHHRPRITAHDGLEWKLHRQIKMRRDERLAALNHGAPVCFERIRRVLQRNLKNAADEKIG